MDQLKIESLPGTHEGVRILRLHGPFTLREVFDFQAAFRACNDPVTLVDLTDVPYMDSASLGAVMIVHTSSQRNHRKYALVGASDRLRTLFEVAGVGEILVTYPTVEEAQQKLAAKASAS
ncbi:MAG TPA: STAS domain-containing protein [Bryobacteraceae bacterium]|nr:STAS domain-containing protein [Bryobacteraceae bacterium]